MSQHRALKIALLSSVFSIFDTFSVSQSFITKMVFRERSGKISTAIILRRYGSDCTYADNQDIVTTQANWPLAVGKSANNLLNTNRL